MSKKAAVFCHNGLGDGVIALVLAHNLHQNGWRVDSFHNGMQALQSWFVHLPIIAYPDLNKIEEILDYYDLLIVFQNDTFDFVLKLIEWGKKKYPEKVKVIYPYPTKGIISKPYYEDSLFDVSKPIVHNLKTFCEDILHFPKSTIKNGIIAPRNLKFRKFDKRVVLHIASSRPGKNWPVEKFEALGHKIRALGYNPVIIAGSKEDRKDYLWLEEKGWDLPVFSTLHEAAEFLYESGYLVGNDSGLAHLASSMGIPILTISRRKKVARFWKPIWAPSRIVVPSSWIPNISGLRLRDRKWQKFISVKKVYRNFLKLIKGTVSI